MNDEQFLRYCAAHCQTEEALFSAAHVRRLADLAGIALAVSGREWWVLRAESADPLIAMAYEKIRAADQARLDETLAAGFVEGALEV